MSQTSNILVVDDDEGLQTLFKRCLKLKGYDVRIANNGLEALEKVAEEKPDLILLDLMMPIMDGVQFAKVFHARYMNADIPIIVVSAADDANRRADEIEADGLLSKPFGIYELLDVVQQYLN